MNLNCGGSYTDSSVWIKNKKAAINAINKKDNKCSQYAVTVALNHEEIKKDPQMMAKIKPFIHEYNWDRLNFLSEKDDWKNMIKISFKYNIKIALNAVYAKKGKIYPTYFSKHNSNHDEQVILLIIPNGEGWD